MHRMTTAERRGYQQICGENGAMMVIACDQRGGMRTLLASTPEAQAAISNDMLGRDQDRTSPATSPATRPACWSIRSAPCRGSSTTACCIATRRC